MPITLILVIVAVVILGLLIVSKVLKTVAQIAIVVVLLGLAVLIFSRIFA